MNCLKKITLMTLLFLTVSPAYAAMVATPQMTHQPGHTKTTDIKTLRQQVAQQLIDHGVDAAEAQQRVNQMTDRQISSLQGEIARLPAGGDVSTTNLLLIIVILILLL